MAVTVKYVKVEVSKPPEGWPFPQPPKTTLADGASEAFAAAFKKSKSKNPEDYPPWELPPGYTILDALKDFATNNKKGSELLLVKADGSMKFKVITFDPASRRCQLESQDGLRIKPVISEREVPLYSPFWK